MTTKTTTPIGPKCTCCNGKGQLPGNRPADAWVKCKPCGGLGRVLGPTVDESNVTEVSPANFCAEASELRLPPGAAPAQLATSLGNRCDFLLCAVSPDSLLYKQGNGCAQLRIFND